MRWLSSFLAIVAPPVPSEWPALERGFLFGGVERFGGSLRAVELHGEADVQWPVKKTRGTKAFGMEYSQCVTIA
jgi:hypothetical protein